MEYLRHAGVVGRWVCALWFEASVVISAGVPDRRFTPPGTVNIHGGSLSTELPIFAEMPDQTSPDCSTPDEFLLFRSGIVARIYANRGRVFFGHISG